jgi:hypothetical protein
VTPEKLEQNFNLLRQQSQNDQRHVPSRDHWRTVLDEDAPHQGWDQHYVYHTGWAARILAATRPSKHVDVSSSVYFASIASAIVPMDFYEHRRTDINDLPGLSCDQADLLHLPFRDDEIQSLSCMHVIEHIGLGRYGDAVNISGDRLAAMELSRSVAKGGQLLMVTPVGQPRLMYNAHRIYSYRMVLDMFPNLRLKEFSMFSVRQNKFIRNANPGFVADENHECGACGCFWFVK